MQQKQIKKNKILMKPNNYEFLRDKFANFIKT